MKSNLAQTQAFYDHSYAKSGFDAQRRYPNEELCRFIGSNIPAKDRHGMRVLEVGCGSGANLWMLANEGFETVGIELSADGVLLAKRMLDVWGVRGTVVQGDMCQMPFERASFDVIVDVFSSNCLNEDGFEIFLGEVARLLKPSGRFFSYTPSKASDAFTNHAPSTLIDESTISGIRRETSPFFGNLYPFRFASAENIKEATKNAQLDLIAIERIGRTYRNGAEYFEFLSYHCKAFTI